MSAKCSKRGWCEGMKLILDRPATRLEVGTLMNLKTGKLRVAGIIYRARPRDRGTLLNYCPWCGAPILFEGRARSASSQKVGAK